jgi:Fe2+ or Zn2+ uptake regulation protein
MLLTLDDIRDRFRAHDVRCTRQRELVYGALAATKSHPTAEEILLEVRQHDPGLSLATVYNTLETLQGAGLCRRLVTAGGPARYDADMNPHAHLIAPDGRVLDLPDDLNRRLLATLSPELAAEIHARTGLRVTSVRLETE